VSFATASAIVDDLERQGLCYSSDAEQAPRGRPSRLVELDATARFGVIVDLTSTEMEISLSDMMNRKVLAESLPIGRAENLRSVVDDVSACISRILKSRNIESSAVMGVMTVVPAMYDRRGDRCLCAAYSWLENSPLKKALGDAVGLPVWVENDANMGAMALSVREHHSAYLVFVYIGEGLGLGIINDGVLLTGAYGLAGEVGHMPLGNPDLRCTCGSYGCLEASLKVSSLRGFAEDPPMLVESSAALGRLVSSLVNLFDPEVVYIGSDLPHIVEDMLPRVKEEMSHRVILDNVRSPMISATGGLHDLFFEGASEQLFRRWVESDSSR